MRGVETGKNGPEKHVPLKMADFLWAWHHGVQRLVCASGHDEGYTKITPMWRRFCNVLGGATEPFCNINARECQIVPFVLGEFHEFSSLRKQ